MRRNPLALGSCVERYLLVQKLLSRWVDEIVTDAPWVITPDFMDAHNVDYVAHDALPYSDASGQADDVYDFVSPRLVRRTLRLTEAPQEVQPRGSRCYHSTLSLQVKKAGKFRETQRTEGISTSDIILRIVRNYNDFVLRNLSRGYSRKELGLSLVRVSGGVRRRGVGGGWLQLSEGSRRAGEAD